MRRFLKLLEKHWLPLQIGMFGFYFASHFLSLNQLPVFADEAIYIRWAQLIMDDWQRYLFFPLNDGKTPLFIWLTVPFLTIFKDQLVAARVLSVIVGAFQIWVMKELVKELKGGKVAQLLAMIFTCILPFWFFYHRIALMDGMMTFFLSLTTLFLLKLVRNTSLLWSEKQTKPRIILLVSLIGFFWGLAILSKLPGLFFAPIFVLTAIYPFKKDSLKILTPKIILVGIAGLLGLMIFFLLKTQPTFGQLFSRGRDFTYSIKDLKGGDWITSFRNVSRFSNWLIFYFTPFIFFISLAGIAIYKLRTKVLYLLICAAFFCGPFLVFGKVVYPRYLLPTTIFFTLAASLVFEYLFRLNKIVQTISFFLLLMTCGWSFYSMFYSLTDRDKVPYTITDRVQYQTEWSAGYGVKEAVDFILAESKKGRVVVATEGYFGTLPDGILLYLHNQDVSNIEVYGIGQPIKKIPNDFEMKSAKASRAFIMVNSHRMLIQDQRLVKVASYPRPFDGPSFDIYELTK